MKKVQSHTYTFNKCHNQNDLQQFECHNQHDHRHHKQNYSSNVANNARAFSFKRGCGIHDPKPLRYCDAHQHTHIHFNGAIFHH